MYPTKKGDKFTYCGLEYTATGFSGCNDTSGGTGIIYDSLQALKESEGELKQIIVHNEVGRGCNLNDCTLVS